MSIIKEYTRIIHSKWPPHGFVGMINIMIESPVKYRVIATSLCDDMVFAINVISDNHDVLKCCKCIVKTLRMYYCDYSTFEDTISNEPDDEFKNIQFPEFNGNITTKDNELIFTFDKPITFDTTLNDINMEDKHYMKVKAYYEKNNILFE